MSSPLKVAEDYMANGEHGKAIDSLNALKPEINNLLWTAYEESGLLYEAVTCARLVYLQNPSMSNTKRYFELLVRMQNYYSALFLLREARSEDADLMKWREAKEAEILGVITSIESQVWLESGIIQRIIKFTTDPTQLKRCFMLCKAWSHHLSSHYRLKMKSKCQEILAHSWRSQQVKVTGINGWNVMGLMQTVPLKKLTLTNCQNIHHVKFADLKNLELLKSNIDFVDLTGLECLLMHDSNVKQWTGNADSLVSLDIGGDNHITEARRFLGDRKLPNLKSLHLGWPLKYVFNFELDRFADTITHLTLRGGSLKFDSFGGKILSKLKSLKLKFFKDVDIAQLNLILDNAKQLGCLFLEDLTFAQYLTGPPHIKVPSNMRVLSMKSVSSPHRDIFMSNPPEVFTMVKCNGFRITGLERLKNVEVDEKPVDENLKKNLIQSAKNGSLKLLAHSGLTPAEIDSVKKLRMTNLITNKVFP